jgi:LCP family protein required for cell wall assembly
LARSPRARESASRPTLADRVLKPLLAAVAAFGLAAGVTYAALALTARHDQPVQVEKTVVDTVVDTVVSPDLFFDGRDRVNVLLIGEDVPLNQYGVEMDAESRSDTSMVITLDRSLHTIGVVSIPRDTRAYIPGHGICKINAATVYGGAPLLVSVVRENLGIEIHHYIKTNLQGFEDLVDRVGGLDIDVERDMDYDDTWQDFHVHLKKGPNQHLDGSQVEGYVRWRKSKHGDYDPKGDVGRCERQQKVMKLLAAKCLQPTMWRKLPDVVAAVRKHLKTDLSDVQVLSLLAFIKGVDPHLIATGTLPGDYQQPFIYIDRDPAIKLLATFFDTTFDPGPLEALNDEGVGRPGKPKGAGAAKDILKGLDTSPQAHKPKAGAPRHEEEPVANDDPGDDNYQPPAGPPPPPAHKPKAKPKPEPNGTTKAPHEAQPKTAEPKLPSADNDKGERGGERGGDEKSTF